VNKRPLSSHYSLPWPVAGVLPETGKLIEHCALADVRIPCERDQVIPLVRAYA